MPWPGRRRTVGDQAGLASHFNREDAVAGMEQRRSQRGHWRRHAGNSRSLNWGGERWFEKIGSASAWARFLIIFKQHGHRQTWLGGVEWEPPEAFMPTFEDSRMLCPSGWMTVTAVLVKTILHPRSANGPKPMRVWGKVGITWPCITAGGGRDGAEARVAMAADLSGRPFATRTPMVGACD